MLERNSTYADADASALVVGRDHTALNEARADAGSVESGLERLAADIVPADIDGPLLL